MRHQQMFKEINFADATPDLHYHLILSCGGATCLQLPEPEQHGPLASNNAAVSGPSTGHLVDTNLDTSIPDTFRAPPAPIPYEKYVGKPPTPSGNRETSGSKSEVALQTPNVESVEQTNTGSSLETKVENLESDEKDEGNIEMVTLKKEVDDEKSDELKSTEPIPPLQDEEDVCPICLEDYDAENPRMTSKCNHHFHLSCIFEWMERSETCAVCNKEMVLSPVKGE